MTRVGEEFAEFRAVTVHDAQLLRQERHGRLLVVDDARALLDTRFTLDTAVTWERRNPETEGSGPSSRHTVAVAAVGTR